ncbi:MAG TPA: RDD family protein, partial [Planctomycetota bacterium]|nr:RDD family protein [Planctomycetota bacterium]
MIESPATSGPDLGKYYVPSDYAGLFRRFAIIAIDLGVVILAFVALKAVQLWLQPDDASRITRSEFWFCVGLSYVYFVCLEASALGTLGFLLTGVKIVTLKGERPSCLRMTFRLLLWI